MHHDANHKNVVAEFLQRPIHVYGATGAEGSAVLDWLISIGVTRIHAHDFSADHDTLIAEWQRVHETATTADVENFVSILKNPAIQWHLADAYASEPEERAIIFVAQSWFRYERNNFLKRFFTPSLSVRPEFQDTIWTITRLYFTLFPGKLIAVTGADGKTTTTRMIGSILSDHAAARGVRCFEMGNDRTHTQSIAAVSSAAPEDYLVLEVSDRQLSFNFSLIPDVAVVTNVTPNKHMDDYGGFDAYVDTKANLLRYQSSHHTAVLNADDEASRETVLHAGHAARHWVAVTERPESGIICDGEAIFRISSRENPQPLMAVAELGVVGRHNWYNAMQAIAACAAVGVPDSVCVDALRKFRGVQHRLQPIRTWRRITFVEDSAGGNPVNIAATIGAFNKQPLVIIAGGHRPQLSLAELQPVIEALRAQHSVAALLLIGSAAPHIKSLIETHAPQSTALHIVDTLPNACEWIKNRAAELTRFQDATVCMTPGFESFDQYRDYRARAQHFIELVNEFSE